jgi:hypothetical protein
MAQLLLSTAGSSLGGSLLGPLGTLAGRTLGGLAGRFIDQALTGGSTRTVEGPRLADLDVMASTEGAPIPRTYGRVRISGQLIWATRLQEFLNTQTDTTGGKGGPTAATTTHTYSYFANFAVGLCEGEIGTVLRVWADGKPLDLTGLTMRIHRGSEDQAADPLIVAKEGADNVPGGVDLRSRLSCGQSVGR